MIDDLLAARVFRLHVEQFAADRLQEVFAETQEDGPDGAGHKKGGKREEKLKRHGFIFFFIIRLHVLVFQWGL